MAHKSSSSFSISLKSFGPHILILCLSYCVLYYAALLLLSLISMQSQRKLINASRRSRKFNMPTNSHSNFHRCKIESILTVHITSWFSNSNAQECRRLRRVVDAALSMIGIDMKSEEGSRPETSPIPFIQRCCPSR